MKTEQKRMTAREWFEEIENRNVRVAALRALRFYRF
jgi:hypothetical protein